MRSLTLLKHNGMLAFLLPKSMLYVDSYNKLREHLFKNTQIVSIYDLGAKFKDVRGEQIILILRKSFSADNKVLIRTVKYKDRNINNQPSFLINQDTLRKMGKMLTFNKIEYYDLINKVSLMGEKLDDVVSGKICRGLPIGGNSEHIKTTGQGEEVIRGRNIAKFNIKQSIVLSFEMANKLSTDKIKYLKNKKIVLQNIFSSEAGVIAAYDARGILTLDTVTNIIVPDDKIGKYILALLNSKLINFYLMYYAFNCSRLTMHLDRSYIGLIPFIKPDSTIFNKVILLAEYSIKEKDPEEQKNMKKILDSLIYGIYSINKAEIMLIENAISDMLSKRSLW